MTDTIKNRNLPKRICFYTFGVIVMYFGVALSVKVDIGVAPGSVIAYSLSKLTPLTVGMCTTIFQIFCVLVQLAITRRFTLKLILQFPLAYVFGFLLDFYLGLMRFELPGVAIRLLLLVAGMIIFSLGIRIIVGADMLLSPPDGLAQTLGRLLGWPMSKSKLGFDIVVTVIAAMLTLILAGNAFLAANVGTVICAAGTGPIIGLFTKLLPFFDVQDKKLKQKTAASKNTPA